MEQNLLIVDDEREILSWLDEMFRYEYKREIGVYVASSALEAIELLDHLPFDVVLTDIHMPQMDGITMFHKIKENWPNCKTVFLTGYHNFDDVYSILKHKDVRYILKSEPDEVIQQAVEEAFCDIEQEFEAQQLKQDREKALENLWMAGLSKLTDEKCGHVNMIPMLREYLALGKRTESLELVEGFKEETKDASKHDFYATEIYYSIATLLLQYINESHIYEKMAFQVALFKLMRVDEHSGWTEAFDYLKQVLISIFEVEKDKQNNLSKRALSRVIEYINEHLADDISLQTLADIGGFNPSYLSRLFKQICNQTVSEYTTNMRMEKAKRLLSETNMKIQDISESVGYYAPQSFARTFRSDTGLSPIEYREAQKK